MYLYLNHNSLLKYHRKYGKSKYAAWTFAENSHVRGYLFNKHTLPPTPLGDVLYVYDKYNMS